MRTHGRISSDEEFPDEANRPLVFRRRRLERKDGRGNWQVLEEQRLAVPFGVEERGAFLAVDIDALETASSSYRASRAAPPPSCRRTSAAGLAAPLPPSTAVRLRIDQLSAVEHATVAGVVARRRDGTLHITAGRGRPLILLERGAGCHDAAARGRAPGERGGRGCAARRRPRVPGGCHRGAAAPNLSGGPLPGPVLGSVP